MRDVLGTTLGEIISNFHSRHWTKYHCTLYSQAFRRVLGCLGVKAATCLEEEAATGALCRGIKTSRGAKKEQGKNVLSRE